MVAGWGKEPKDMKGGASQQAAVGAVLSPTLRTPLQPSQTHLQPWVLMPSDDDDDDDDDEDDSRECEKWSLECIFTGIING